MTSWEGMNTNGGINRDHYQHCSRMNVLAESGNNVALPHEMIDLVEMTVPEEQREMCYVGSPYESR